MLVLPTSAIIRIPEYHINKRKRKIEEYGGYKPIPMQKKTLHQENL